MSIDSSVASPVVPQMPANRRVVLVPPLLMPSLGMKPLQWRMERAGFRTALFSYPSYRQDIPANARALAAFLMRLGEEPIDVVTFSMGAVLLRWAVNHHRVPALGRVVMLAPPNHGSFMADFASRLFGNAMPLFLGKCAPQLRTGPNGLAERAGILPPGTQLGIIAGGTGTQWGYNPIGRQDNDRIVTLEETTLPGTRERIVVRLPHGPLVFHPETARLTAGFLFGGTFPPSDLAVRSEAAPHAINALNAQPE